MIHFNGKIIEDGTYIELLEKYQKTRRDITIAGIV